jgi:predicted Zn finger-like uncharacterized protein
MIVVCEGCKRRFQVDDARIPVRGARVRCKRCHHRFRVFPPESGAAEPEPPSVDADASLSGDATPHGRTLPEGELRFVTELPQGPDESASEPDAPGESAPPGAASGASHEGATGPGTATAGAGEDAWEFAASSLSFDPSTSGRLSFDPSASGRQAPLAASGAEASGAGLDPASTLPPPTPIEHDPSAIVPPPPGSGPDPDFFDLSGSAAYGQGIELAGPEPGAGDSEPPAQAAGSTGAEVTDEASAASGPLPEIGSRADWDRLAGHEPEPAPPPHAPVAAAEEAHDEDLSFELDLPAAVSPASAPHVAWLEHVGWALSLVLLLAVAQGSVRIEPVAPEVPPGQVELLGLSAENVRGRFVETARSGTLFVVSGELHNRGRDPLRPGRALQLVLLDEADRPLPDASVLVGTALPESAVRETPIGALALQEELRAQALAGRSLAPGESTPFHALVSELPEQAVRFRIEPAPAVAPAGAGGAERSPAG